MKKKLLSIILSIALIVSPFTSTITAMASNADEMQAIEDRINNLPSPASFTTPVSSSLVSQLKSIYNDMYTILNRKDGTTPPPSNLEKLFDISDKCTIVERCDFYEKSSHCGQYIHSKFPTNPADELYKEQLKELFRDIRAVPFENRLSKRSGNYWNNIRNEVDGYFTIYDRLNCLIPETLEQVEAMSEAEATWYITSFNEASRTWAYLSQALVSEDDYNVLNIDPYILDVLEAFSKKALTLQAYAETFPNSNACARINWDDTDRVNKLRDKVKYFYDRLFNKVPLSPGETMPNLGLHPNSPAYSVSLITTAEYVLTPQERIDYLPTVAELAGFSEAQRNMVINELNAIYIDLNSSVPASEWPDLTKLKELTPVLQTLGDRMNRLPLPAKINELNSSQLDDVRTEIFTLYDMLMDLSDSDSQPPSESINHLRMSASEALTIQERINMLPTVSELDNGGTYFNKYAYDEAVVIRGLIDALPPGTPLPDETKLTAIEEYFSPSDGVDIYNESDLVQLVNEMNSSDTPLNKIGNIMADFSTSSTITLNQGTLTLYGNNHEVCAYGISLNSSAVLNLGKRVYTSKNDLVISSNANNNQTSGSAGYAIFYMKGSSRLNICKGVTICDSTARSSAGGIALDESSKLNMYGGTIDNCANTSTSTAGAVFMTSYSEFNMYDGTISNCYGYRGGAVGLSGSTNVFHMYGGEIHDCYSGGNGGGAISCSTASSNKIIIDGGKIYKCTAGSFVYTDSYGVSSTISGSGYGGAIFSTSSQYVQINGGEIYSCSAMYGGGVAVHTNSGAYIYGAKIHNNTSTQNGGGVYGNNNSIIIGKDTEIYENESLYGGGVFAKSQSNVANANGAHIKIKDNAYIHHNSAVSNASNTGFCGGVYSYTGTLEVTDNAVISENDGVDRGGAIYTYSSDVVISGEPEIAGNYASNGGAIFILNAGTLNISGGYFHDNMLTSKSSGLGGVIYANKGSITVSGGEFYDNEGVNGGCVALAGASFTMTGGEIFSNTGGKGGAVLGNSANSSIYLYDGLIAQNIATLGNRIGGGIYSAGTLVVADGFKLYDNRASIRGDDIYFSSTSKELTLGEACHERLFACHEVDGWYTDSYGARWTCYIDVSEEPNESVPAGVYPAGTSISLKAAHLSFKVESKDDCGRLLNEITQDTPITPLSSNSAVTIHRDFERKGGEWYIGASDELPAGTKLTLMYYPNGDEASGVEYYHYEVTEASNVIALSDFKLMGEDTSFVRTDSNDHFVSQLSIVFPESNTLDSVSIWLADTEFAQYAENASSLEMDFSNGVNKPEADISISNEDSGENRLSATVSVENLGSLERDKSDPEQMLGEQLDDYTPLLTVELLDFNGKRIAYPEGTTVSINGVDIDVSSGVAVAPITGDGDFDIDVEGLPEGSYQLRASVCFATDSVTSNPMAIVVDSATGTALGVTAKHYAIKAELSGDEVNRIFKAPSSNKSLAFDVKYLPDSEDASKITIVSYKKQTDGSYAETATPWAFSVNGNAGNASASVTVPEGTPVGTYRLVFKIESASVNYNLILTEE